MRQAFKTEFNPEDLEKFRKGNFTRISTFKDLIDSYREYAPTINKGRIKLGFPSIDNYLRITPSDNILVMAKTSGKKTTFGRNVALANHESLKDRIIVVFSLELLEPDEAERYLSNILDMPTEVLEKRFAEGDIETIEKAYELSGKHDNIVTITDTIDVADIIPFIMYIEQLTEKSVGLVIVDYAQLVEDSQYIDEFKAMAAIAKKFKKINMALRKNFILISQVGRESAKNKDGLDMFSAKGSGNFENSTQIALSLEMPDPTDIRVDKETKQTIFPFGIHQQEIVDLINQYHYLEFHTLNIRKKKKYYMGVPKPTCIIQYNATNLRMTEFEPKYIKPPDLNNPF